MIFWKLFQRKKVTVFSSRVNKKITVVNNSGEKVIYVGDAEQTGGTITGMWRKTVSKLPKNQYADILILGLGGGDLVRIIRKKYPQARISAVELDPEMIKIARDFFQIKEGNKLKIINQDAAKSVRETESKFDLIFIDLFIGKNNPSQFRTEEFLKGVAKIKKKNGLIIYNSHFNEHNTKDFSQFKTRCQKVFARVEVIVSYRYSRILLLA